jgi:conjugative transposon TraN protein
MKQIIGIILAMIAALSAIAQQPQGQASHIAGAYSLQVATNKTTLLIFPAPIKDGVRGTKDILAEKAKDVDNILKLKAASELLEESNLHVITTDGKVYSFSVGYDPAPASFTIDVKSLPVKTKATFRGLSLNEREIEDCAAAVSGSTPFIKRVGHKKHGMHLVLEGIFIKNDVLFFRYNLKNQSQIRYDAEPYEFYVRDKKRSKRTAVQDKEIEPVFTQIRGLPEDSGGQTIIVAFAKFTIAENKLFMTTIQESGGDRSITCKLDQKKLLQAKQLPH